MKIVEQENHLHLKNLEPIESEDVSKSTWKVKPILVILYLMY